MSRLEGTDSKPRNQILETRENDDSSERKSNDSDDRKTRSQTLETRDNDDASEKDEKLVQKDGNEDTKSKFEKDKRSLREWISDRLKQHKEIKENKEHSENDKPESKKENAEDKKSEFDFSWGTFQRDETKTNDVPDKKNNNETGNNSDDTNHATSQEGVRAKDSSGIDNHSSEIRTKKVESKSNVDMER